MMLHKYKITPMTKISKNKKINAEVIFLRNPALVRGGTSPTLITLSKLCSGKVACSLPLDTPSGPITALPLMTHI